jgi:hypothetical protein
MVRSVVISTVVVGLAGCCCTHDTRGPSNVCEVHHVVMKSVTVPGWGGCKLPTATYAEARQNLFPHVYPLQVDSPWPWKRKQIYICDACVIAENEWGIQQEKANQAVQRTGASPSAQETNQTPSAAAPGQ